MRQTASDAKPDAPRRRRRRLSLSTREALWAYAFLLLPLAFYGFLRIYPAIQSFNLSLHRWHVDPAQRTYLGLSYYREMLTDPKLHQALRNTLLYAAIVVPAQLVLADGEVVAFLDARPLFKGHVLVMPRQHHETLPALPAALVEPLFGRVRQISAIMPGALGAQGSFVALNNTVSQSVPHLHVHVVPRTRGDGLRGFFWPRHRYASDEEAEGYARRLRDALGTIS